MEEVVMDCALNEFYKHKRVFITGHTGFKGSWLALWLQEARAEICGYALAPNTYPNHFQLQQLRIHNHKNNINDAVSISNAISQFAPQIVFHLAAQSLVRFSYQHPIETFDTNVIGTLKVYEACRKCDSVKAVVSITSDKVYRNNESADLFVESDELGGADPYSASKSCAEWMSESYRNSFLSQKHFALATARAGNVIGGGDWSEDRLMPDLMKAAAQKKSCTIRNPTSVRPWQHVLETVSGYLLLGKYLFEKPAEYAQPWNFGPQNNETMDVNKVVEIAKSYWSNIAAHRDIGSAELMPESKNLRLSSEKAKMYLRWSPVWNTEQAIQKTVDWYRLFYEEGKVSSIQQLDEYIQDANFKGAEWAK